MKAYSFYISMHIYNSISLNLPNKSTFIQTLSYIGFMLIVFNLLAKNNSLFIPKYSKQNVNII